jgi:diguanylate cyclase (GGDEF)-like protein/PAS domain S-box-containing protein
VLILTWFKKVIKFFDYKLFIAIIILWPILVEGGYWLTYKEGWDNALPYLLNTLLYDAIFIIIFSFVVLLYVAYTKYISSFVEEQLILSEFMINSVNNPIAMYTTNDEKSYDKEYTYVMVNKAYCNLYRLRPENIIGKLVTAMWPEDYRVIVKNLDKAITGQEVVYTGPIRFPALGERLYKVTYTPYPVQTKYPTHVVAILDDVTEERMALDKMSIMVYRDPLTQLPNKRYLEPYVITKAKKCENDNTHLSVLFCDLDNFKDINDESSNHEIGDEVIRLTAKRLQTLLRGDDRICRRGKESDEFVIIISDLPADSSLKISERIAKRIVDKFRHPFIVQGKEYFVTISVGVTIYPLHASLEDILSEADKTMYLAKADGKNKYKISEKVV